MALTACVYLRHGRPRTTSSPRAGLRNAVCCAALHGRLSIAYA